ncbi:3-phosphoshikimate 1-carboxyvinyltransferase [Bradyrhizobium sp. USDA 4524]|uniref:3-phosphoshikimate 1-carboxyvinyltransferase n=1 Tax=unclassified Bradyrhizobium TaxID=2631580 RepID=UPI00209DD4C9|nr:MULTISPECIES: 3-phosphoshikimate 1-carboxyvinyltransferase [unclassified Bradyrhizobium]MCP1845966.1 3-phosphoshikimate 1-carboxyvinyltransferase [Bradyrhizobium sp. USDA 4538]MCP1907400.1 3-phosphoshikimate 1-carboxyvinyltransferase [Bradyrhizobium sp. USDA 4537]MCP1985186.1 3-phosphoshikimate 1-carboxyvinyltransferase [Bradyrhizobium sp. USDA 4539]
MHSEDRMGLFLIAIVCLKAGTLPHSASTTLSQASNHRILIEKFTGELDGVVVVPGSKSITNRAIMMALCSRGGSTIRNPLDSDDTKAGLAAAEALGCKIEKVADGFTVYGIGRDRPVTGTALNVHSAGTVARFLPCVLAMGGAGEWQIVASKQMTMRPMKGLFDALAMLGECIQPLERPGFLPALVRGGAITNTEAFVDGGVSSQYLSGLLIAAPQAEHPMVFRTDGHVVQRQYVDITLDCMRAFGAEVDATSDLSKIRVQPTGYFATDFQVEADASTASYFAALPAALKGTLVIPNAIRHSRQPDTRFIDLIAQLGCEVAWLGSKGVRISRPATLLKLKGGFTLDLNDCSDIALTVAALAPYADAPIEIQGVAHIRNHECDRVDAMTQALLEVGVPVEERADGWKVFPGIPRYAELRTRDDHRMAMSLAVLGAAGGGVSLDHPECVAKTCPEFYRLISQVGLAVRDIPPL